uniref:RRM domain-containing protein n=1 Tax=Ascaris lumbricoides TaxID=6252 RepID=A0A9J2PAS1_ASCLU
MSVNGGCGHVLHVSNICMSATNEQIYQLFSFIGRIAEFKMYPTDNHLHLSKFTHKFAFVKFEERISVKIAQHLTNTVFIDRALICTPFQSDTIPDEETALKCGGPALCGQRQLPPNVLNKVQDLGDGQQMLYTIDPTLTALGLPPYPALSANMDERRIEEIRRTIYVGNLPKECDSNELMWFFNDNIGEVMYLRMASFNDSLPCAYAYIEFASQPTVLTALQNNGIIFKGKSLCVQHSRVAIVKPERKTMNMALQEVEEAIKVQQDSEKSANVLCKLNQGLAVTRAYAPLWSSNHDRSRSADRRPRSRSRSSDRQWHRSAYHRSGSRSHSANHSHHHKERRESRKRQRSEAEKNNDNRKRSRSRTQEKRERQIVGMSEHLKNEGKNDTEEGGSKPDAKVEDCKPNADATGSGSGTKKQKREKRAKGNCERRYSGAATAAEQKQMKHEVAMDVDPAPSSFTVTAFGDRVLKRISAWNTENQGNEGMVKEKGGGDIGTI